MSKNNSSKYDSKQLINDLRKQLSNNSREYELSEQINDQLEKIRLTSIKIKDILNRLLYEIADLTDQQLEDLHQKEYEAKIELKKLETRYQMLKNIKNNECLLYVNQIPIENNKLVMNNKRDEEVVNDSDTDIDNSDTDIEEDLNTRSVSSGESVVSYITNGFSQRLSPRKRILPERFESFPSKKRSKRLLNGSNRSFICMAFSFGFAFVFYVIAFYPYFSSLLVSEVSQSKKHS